MTERRFRQVDVFTTEPYLGNPLAVVLDAEGLTGEQMQRFARWTNLSETTFVLPPDGDADYRVRIFTPATELPFAGHPTLGSAHAWLDGGGQPRQDGTVVQQCGAGLVEIRRGPDGLAFAAPPLIRSGPADPASVARAVDVLGLRPGDVVDAAWVDNGPGWLGVLLGSAEAVLAVRPQDSDLYLGVAGPDGAGGFEVRAFFPVAGRTLEDPVTGSLNASLAQWLLATGRASAPYTARQGRVLGRDGRVRISVEDGRVWTGGSTVTCVAGTVAL